MFVDPDDSTLQLDYSLVQKFAQVQVSPPVDANQLEQTSEQLRTLSSALRLKGSAEIYEGKARLLKDESWLEGDEYKQICADVDKLDPDTRKQLDMIKRHKVSFGGTDERGINVDEELSDGEVEDRLTKLEPPLRRQQLNGGAPAG